MFMFIIKPFLIVSC